MDKSIDSSINLAIDGWLLDRNLADQTGTDWFKTIRQACSSTFASSGVHMGGVWDEDIPFDVFQRLFLRGPASPVIQTYDPLYRTSFKSFLYIAAQREYFHQLRREKKDTLSIIHATDLMPYMTRPDTSSFAEDKEVQQYIKKLLSSKLRNNNTHIALLDQLFSLQVTYIPSNGKWTDLLSDPKCVNQLRRTLGLTKKRVVEIIRDIRNVLKMEKIFDTNFTARERRKVIYHHRLHAAPAMFRWDHEEQIFRYTVDRSHQVLRGYRVELVKPSDRKLWLRIRYMSEKPKTPKQINDQFETGFLTGRETPWIGDARFVANPERNTYVRFSRIIRSSELGLSSF